MFATTEAPQVHNPHVAMLGDRQSIEAEQFQRLRYRIEEIAVGRPLGTVAVTSAVAGDGKTLTAINLALALAQGRENRILLIDADLRRPNVASTLGLEATPGLLTLLGRGGVLDGYLRRVHGSQLDILPCESGPCDTYETLTSPAFAKLVALARTRYRTIVFDTAPVIPVPDSSLLGRHADGFVVVVGANSTPRKLLGETLTLLGSSSVVGLVFNRDERPLFGYRHSYQAYFQSAAR